MLLWSLIDTTSITSIQIEKCNQFSCRSFKTDIFQSEEKMVACLVIFGHYLICYFYNFVMDNNFFTFLTIRIRT